MRALRANVKPAHCKFKGRTFSANFLPLQAPVFFPQPTILALGRCQRLLNRFLYGHLHMKQQPRYAFSTVVRYTAVLPSCKQFIECRVRSTAIKHTSGHVVFWPQPVGSLPLAQNAWHICMYIRSSSTLRMRALRANVKPAHCKFKGRTFSAHFFVTQQTPVFLPQLTILALRRCQRLLNRSLYGHLHMKQQHAMRFYGESYAIQRPCCSPVNSLSAVFGLLS